MWEAIAANRRRSVLLIALMGVILVTLGAAVGMLGGTQFDSLSGGAGLPESRDSVLSGAIFGALGAAVLWLVLWTAAVYGGDQLMLQSVHARRIIKSDSPRLWNTVEEMSLAAGLPHMPRVYLVEDPAPNAFAVGRNPEHAAVAVTTGLLRLLNRDELQGVVAHEIGHVHNLDIRFMTIAAVLVGSVELVSRSILQVGPYASHGRRGGGGRSNKGAGILLALVFVLAAVSPLLAQLLYLACSRQREYLADASAARFTRYPEGLALALEKIAVHQSGYKVENVNRAVAALCIINPIEHLKLSSVVSTHPPTETRIKILRSMGGGAGYVDYEAAWKRIQGREGRLTALEAAARSGERLSARPASSDPESAPSGVDRAREVADLIDRFANYLLIPCACGMRIKVPPEYDREAVECPRCSRLNALPAAAPAAAGGTATAHAEAAPEAQLPTAQTAGGALRYDRRSQDWDGFRCPCGQTIQLGPDFPLDYTVCANCNRRIEIGKKPVGETMA
ncbi:MAG: M48 family metallopeptidase [Bryobacterales bacterium]